MTPLHEKPLSDRSPERLKAPLGDRPPAEQQASVAVAERREALPVDDAQRTQVVDGDGTQRQSVAGIGHVTDNSASRAPLVAAVSATPVRPIEYANLTDLGTWAAVLMARAPDVVIGDPAAPYMRRWWVIPRNEHCNVYLHEILRSDDDRALHDHPWGNTSLLIAGRYVEHTPEGSFLRERGWSGTREASAAHRLEILPGESSLSLFITGPKVRDWGFHCPKGWVPWQQFTGGAHGELVGRGCE